MSFKFLSILLCLVMVIFLVQAQEKCPVKFGHVIPEDFDISKLTIDTTDGAVVIADVGKTTFEGNTIGSFTLNFKRQCRIKIINKNGFDLADIAILLYRQGDKEEKLEMIKGTTYNLENGQIVETKLKNDAIFGDKYDKNHTIKKFTLPAIKEGSIIEYSYTLSSDFVFNLQPWEFQGSYPKVWSEYEVDIPDFFQYVSLFQGYQSFYIHDAPHAHMSFYTVKLRNDDIISLSGDATDNRWVMKNVPTLKKEKFITTINNYISKISFQLSGQKFPGQPYEDIMGTWPKASERLLQYEDFGESLDKKNGWLDDEMKIIIANSANDLDKARKIYYYVKNNIKSTDVRGIYLNKPVKDVFKNKSGTIAEVNMLLTTMLQHEKLQADPIILSTRDNGYTNEIYPLIDRYNYVICQLTIDSTNYFLDATRQYLGFGRLPDYCYNGQARVINKDSTANKNATALYFLPDTLQEAKLTSIMLLNDDKVPGKWNGSFKSYPGYYESSDIREQLAAKGKPKWEKDLISSYKDEYSISDIEVTDLNDDEKPIEINYKLTIDGDTTSSIIYFNPMIEEGYAENYFKSLDRKYPVEMLYKMDETYVLNMDIPEGYEVDELPESVRVNLNDTDGYFEYLVSKGDGTISMRSRIKLNKAKFLPDEYQDLRSFFDYIVKKNNEQIVFKRKNN